MTRPADPSRPAPPTVREIAELTARLREVSARGRDVDPVERERFQADKDALIARITDADHSDRRGPEMPEWMREQARQTEAERATKPVPEQPSDDTAALLERLGQFRAAHGGKSPGAHGADYGPSDVARAPGRTSPATQDDAGRREQLARWHAEDQTAEHDLAAEHDPLTRFTPGGYYPEQGGTR